MLESCTIDLFGSLRLQMPDRSITRFHTRKIASLLATLAYHRNRAFRREELIEIIWPDCDPESGRNRLRIALCGLRNDLESVGAPAPLLVADRMHVHLDPEAFQTD